MTQRAALAGASEERRADIEYESSMWMVACPCGWEQSVWDSGGVRYHTQGAKTQLRRCDSCGKRRLHQLYYAGDETPREVDSEDASPPAPAVPAAARAGLSFGIVFAILAVAKVTIERIYSGPIPSWFLVFLIAGAIAGSQAGRPRRQSSFNFGCLVVMLLMFLFMTMAYFAKIRELT